VADIEKLKEDIVELQSQMAFQEDTVQHLNEAMALQQQEILTLRRQFELLKQRQEEQATAPDQATDGPTDERPPHY
jgi:SlyX protein